MNKLNKENENKKKTNTMNSNTRNSNTMNRNKGPSNNMKQMGGNINKRQKKTKMNRVQKLLSKTKKRKEKNNTYLSNKFNKFLNHNK